MARGVREAGSGGQDRRAARCAARRDDASRISLYDEVTQTIIAQAILELLDSAAQRDLLHIESCGRTREAFRICSCDGISQLVKFDGQRAALSS